MAVFDPSSHGFEPKLSGNQPFVPPTATFKIKKNAIIAIQRDSDTSSLEEEEEDTTNLCPMTNDDEVNFEKSFEFIFDELFKAFHGLTNDLKKIRLKNKELKSSNISLAKEKSKIFN